MVVLAVVKLHVAIYIYTDRSGIFVTLTQITHFLFLTAEVETWIL
jgi:hypothetical protein